MGFNILIEMHERRGRLREALSVAEFAVNSYDQCETERWHIKRKVDVASGKPFKREIFIPAKVPTQHPFGANPGDSGWSSLAPDGPHGGSVAHWYYWWNESHQEKFEQLWSSASDRIADALADDFGFAWPWLIGEAIAAKDPHTFKLIEQFSASLNDGKQSRLHASDPESIATWGAFHVVRQRRTWQEASAIVCPVCSKGFWSGDVTAWAHKKFGPARYCMDCCLQSREGDPRPTWTKDGVIEALRQLYDAFDIIPQQKFSYSHIPYQGSQEKRDNRMRALVNAPNIQTIKDVLELDDWLAVLRTAGLVGETWRPSRGTLCYANDGHKCRSLLEKSIDDWLSASEIEHECEPRWPRHPDLNPSGAKRADWVLNDGTYIECAGMMEDSKYLSKIADKRRLAEILGIRLMIITPTDIGRLDEFFKV